MKLQTEQYMGYPIKFVNNILKKGDEQERLVEGKFKSKLKNKMMTETGPTKEKVLDKCKKDIDKELKVRGVK